jgi:hypothetical protein
MVPALPFPVTLVDLAPGRSWVKMDQAARMMNQIGTYLVAQCRIVLGGTAMFAVVAMLYAWAGATRAHACMDGGNYNFNENWNYNENWNFNNNTNTNSNYNSSSSSSSSSSTSVTIRTTVSG